MTTTLISQTSWFEAIEYRRLDDGTIEYREYVNDDFPGGDVGWLDPNRRVPKAWHVAPPELVDYMQRNSYVFRRFAA